MPDKPFWYYRLDEVIGQLEKLPHPFVDRATLEVILGIGRRGASRLADIRALVDRPYGPPFPPFTESQQFWKVTAAPGTGSGSAFLTLTPSLRQEVGASRGVRCDAPNQLEHRCCIYFCTYIHTYILPTSRTELELNLKGINQVVCVSSTMPQTRVTAKWL